MIEKTYILVLVAVFFLTVGILLYKKEKQTLTHMYEMIDSKEKGLIELYESIEELMKLLEREYSNISKPRTKQYDRTKNSVVKSIGLNNYNQAGKTTKVTSAVNNDNSKLETLNNKDTNNKKSNYDNDDYDNIKEDSKNNKVINLHNRGYSDSHIAKKLNIGIGEVKLIIGLSFKGR